MEFTPQEARMPATTTTAQPLWFLANLARIHASGDETGGSYGVVEITGAPGDMPPLHVHHEDDEAFYVLEGRLRVHVGDSVRELDAGDFALAPHGIPHVYEVISDTPARWLALSSGRFEEFVREVSVDALEPTLPPTVQGPPPEELGAIAARHGIELLGPPGTRP
jgi:quercetin dioxygenase-like cupin family protein